MLQQRWIPTSARTSRSLTAPRTNSTSLSSSLKLPLLSRYCTPPFIKQPTPKFLVRCKIQLRRRFRCPCWSLHRILAVFQGQMRHGFPPSDGRPPSDFLVHGQKWILLHRVRLSLPHNHYSTFRGFAGFKENGNWSKAVVQFRALGLPPAAIHQRGQIMGGGGGRPHLGTKRSDRYMLQINGLDQVDWSGVDKLVCIAGGKSASAADDNSGDDFTDCALNNN
jgi:hypothetical protein